MSSLVYYMCSLIVLDCIEKVKMVVGTLFNKMRERRRSSRRSSRGSSNGSIGMGIECCGKIKILMLGDHNVGKSSICFRYVADSMLGTNKIKNENEEFESSVFLAPQNKKEKVRQYELNLSIADTLFRRRSVERYKQKIVETDAFVLVYSKDSRQSYIKLIDLISDIHKIKKVKIPIIILGNKNDLKQAITHVQEKGVLGDYPHFDVSAQENDGIQEAFKFLVRLSVEHVVEE
ncbi:ras-related protein Rab-9A-like [Hydractinia symbiolongicarpus]|uniref:ras-related protein Rab-9A-like n=1 Tax=Hydractinia symbiolongicarpus TaxID=13093 RepID=UPI00254AD4C2|nr:ras-related protein Rab-9A-like [Hydractinia symbiolongicarpus]